MELKVWDTSQIAGRTDRDYDLTTERRFAKVTVLGRLDGDLDYGGTNIRITRVHELKGLDLDEGGPVWLGVDFEVLDSKTFTYGPFDFGPGTIISQETGIKLLEIRNAAGEVVAEAPLIVYDLEAAIDIVRRNTEPARGAALGIDALRSLEVVKGLPEGVQKFTVLQFSEEGENNAL